MSKDFLKIFIETNNFFAYRSEKKGFKLRFYAGITSIKEKISPGVDYRIRLDGYSGENDYLFDEVFPGRTETTGVLAQQFVVADAGFKMPTGFFRIADKWMVGLNMSTTLPGILPFRLFADLGTYNDAGKLYNEDRVISFEAGVEVDLIKDIFTIYLPVKWSSDIQYIVDFKQLHYGNLVRFEFHLNKLNPLELIRKNKI